MGLRLAPWGTPHDLSDLVDDIKRSYATETHLYERVIKTFQFYQSLNVILPFGNFCILLIYLFLFMISVRGCSLVVCHLAFLACLVLCFFLSN